MPRVQYYHRYLGNRVMALGGSLDTQLLHHDDDTQEAQDKCRRTLSKGRVGIRNRRLTPRNSLITLRETGIRNTMTRTIDICDRNTACEETRDNIILQRQNTLHSWGTTPTHNINHKANTQFLVQDDKILTQDNKIEQIR